MARLKAAALPTRERLANLIETSLDRVFDAPLDIRTPHEALYAIDPKDMGGPGAATMRRAAEWGATRAVRRIGLKYGSKLAGRSVAPIGMAVEFGFSARDGVRELQVLASFLAFRLRHEGYPHKPELLRRTVLALYLEPGLRPDLRVSLRRRSLAVAKRWSMDTVPLTTRRQSLRTQHRVHAIAQLALAPLVEDWNRVSAMEARTASSQGAARDVGEARLGEAPALPVHVVDAEVKERPPPAPGAKPTDRVPPPTGA